MQVAMEGKMPALFLGHGSPMNIVLDNDFTRSLAALTEELPRPEAILVISAHWLTDGTFVGCQERPSTIHDFYGFPRELYQVNYGAPGAPVLARAVCDRVSRVAVACDETWGLDHASYSVLRHMYPAADVPVFEMSLDYAFNDWYPKPVRHHYELARELRPLRREGVLIIGSGNLVHNLRLIDFSAGAEPYEWALEADAAIKDNLVRGDHDALIDYAGSDKPASLAVPTLDHYLPMIYALALQEEGEDLRFTYEGIAHGSVSMRCFRVG